jgi:hypothetical protein
MHRLRVSVALGLVAGMTANVVAYIEQLDDVDLGEKARRARSGVHAIDGAGLVFETKRALRVGLRVVEEFRQSAGQGR